MSSVSLPDPEQLRTLADFRYALRQFLHFSEQAAEAAGLHAQQHQLMLQVAGCPPRTETTVGYVAERLGLRHHTVVELSKRCEDQGLLERSKEGPDRRCILLHVTQPGLQALERLSHDHARELYELAPRLMLTLERIQGLGRAGAAQADSVPVGERAR